jgi:hypothetical protein
MPSRKSVSAAASSSLIRRKAWVNLARRLRIVALASSVVAARGRAVGIARPGAGLDRVPLLFRPFFAFAAIALFRFFMAILLNEGLRGFTKTG